MRIRKQLALLSLLVLVVASIAQADTFNLRGDIENTVVGGVPANTPIGPWSFAALDMPPGSAFSFANYQPTDMLDLNNAAWQDHSRATYFRSSAGVVGSGKVEVWDVNNSYPTSIGLVGIGAYVAVKWTASEDCVVSYDGWVTDADATQGTMQNALLSIDLVSGASVTPLGLLDWSNTGPGSPLTFNGTGLNVKSGDVLYFAKVFYPDSGDANATVAAFDVTVTTSPVPEPATIALLGLGAAVSLCRKNR